MKSVREVDDIYLFHLLGAILTFYAENKEYPETLYLRPDEYNWVREKLNVFDHIKIGHVVVGILPLVQTTTNGSWLRSWDYD